MLMVKPWIYLEYVRLNENSKHYTLGKYLKTNNGREYYNHKYFESVRIILESTTSYTPQQNGVVKYKNRVLIKMVNAMLSNWGLSLALGFVLNLKGIKNFSSQ